MYYARTAFTKSVTWSDCGSILFADLSFQNKIHILANSLTERTDDGSDFRKKLFDVEGERNRLVHSFYMPSFGSSTAYRIKFTGKGKHGFRINFEAISQTVVLELADKVSALNTEFSGFMASTFPDFQMYLTGFYASLIAPHVSKF